MRACPQLGKLRHAAPNPSPLFLKTSAPSATRHWGRGSRQWRRWGSSTTPSASPAGRALGSWLGSATTKRMGAPCAMPATRYLSSHGDNQHPQGGSRRCGPCGWELGSHGVTPTTQATLEKCAKCQGLITERIVRALGKGFHPDCFSCAACGRAIGAESFAVDEQDEVYCVADFYRLGSRNMAVLVPFSLSPSPHSAHAAPVCSHQEIRCGLQCL